MLRSSYCSLFDHSDTELTDLGECPYDQVRLSNWLITVDLCCSGCSSQHSLGQRGQQGHACMLSKPS